jgi:hypothetical protein
MNDCITNEELKNPDIIENPVTERIKKTISWKDKLKPSTKNKIIQNKYSDIFSQRDTSSQYTENFPSDNQIYSSNYERYSENEKLITSNADSCSDKWNKYLEESRIQNEDLDVGNINILYI